MKSLYTKKEKAYTTSTEKFACILVIKSVQFARPCSTVGGTVSQDEHWFLGHSGAL